MKMNLEEHGEETDEENNGDGMYVLGRGLVHAQCPADRGGLPVLAPRPPEAFRDVRV